MSDRALFAVAPYVAAACLVAGSLFRFLRTLRGEGGAARPASRVRETFGGSRAWTLGLAVVAAGHLMILGFPALVLAWNRALVRLIALEVVLFASGILALVGLSAILIRQARCVEARARTSMADAAFLGLLLVAVASGLGLAALYRWAASWSVITLTPYLHSLPTLEPKLALMKPMPYLVKLHVFSATALIALLPFTRVLDALLLPLHRTFGRLQSRLGEALQRGRRGLEEAIRLGGTRLGWREEED